MDKVVHFEIPIDDPDRAKTFYSAVFGWQFADLPGMDYTLVTTVPTDEQQTPVEPGAINGGLVKRTAQVGAPVLVVNVSSVDEYLDKISTTGGSVIRPTTEIPGMGRYAYVADSEGNVIGLWQDLPPSPG